MFSLNRVQLIGYVTQPVELRQTPGGQSVVDINVCTPYSFKSESGEQLTGQGYHSVTAWGGMAEVASQFCKPGSQVFIAGRLQTDSWEDEQSGEKRSKTRIVAMDLILLDPKDGQHELPTEAKSLTTCLNRADVVGNLTRDPEMRTTTSGQNVLTLGIASNERWKDKASGEMKERTEFHNVVIWGDLAQQVMQHAKKGMRMFASGRVQTRSWETQSGSKRTTTEIVAETVSILGVKNTDISVTTQTFAERKGQGSTTPTAPSPSASPNAPSPQTASTPAPVATETPSVPQYESEVKVEDLPF